MGLVRHEIGLSDAKKRFPLKGTCLGIYSRVLNTRDPLPLVLQSVYPWCAQWEDELKKLFGAYVEAKQQQNVLDYDDLLAFWADMMAEPALAGEVGERFDHLLVDEYQDTNRLQADILLAMKPSGQGVTVVGDDAQTSIPSGARRCATSWTSRRSSRSRRAWSRWSATTAAPRPSSMRATR